MRPPKTDRRPATAERRSTAISLLSLLCITFLSVSAPVANSEAATFRPAIAKPLKAAQEAIRKKQWSAALDNINTAQHADSLSASDRYAIDELLGYVLYRQSKYADAAVVYERQLESPLLPPDQAEARTKSLAQLYYRVGDYPKAIAWAKRFLKSQPMEPEITELLGESYFRMNDFKNAASTMTKLIDAEERNHREPKESWLRIVQNSYYRSGEASKLQATLVQLVRYHQKPDDWRALLDLHSADVHDDQLSLEYHRLTFDLDLLDRAEDYEEMVLESLDANVAGLAQRVLDRAKAQKVFPGPNTLAGSYQRLTLAVQKQLASNNAFLYQYDRTMSQSVSAVDAVLAGQIYLSQARYDEAIVALRKGIEAGGGNHIDQARLQLGIAEFKTAHIDRAGRAFDSIDNRSEWGKVAQLWKLRLGADAK